jgi:protoheme IX farnesyltransferase
VLSGEASAAVARALIETTKPGITKLVTITSAVGFALALLRDLGGSVAALGGAWGTSVVLAAAIVGTACAAAGANALNQWWERGLDARMERTRRRPIPSGRIEAGPVLAFGAGLTLLGTLVLALACGIVAAGVSLACTLTYLAWYTPSKPRTPMSTLVGAIPGALPVMIGWSAATRADDWHVVLEPGAMALFALMFVWQLPHFLAIAWMYRDDYARGGFRVLPTVEADGRVTSVAILLTSVLFVPAAMLPAVLMWGVLGAVSLIAGAVSGVLMLVLAVRLVRSRERGDARRVFFASIIVLPVMLAVIVGDALVRSLVLS